MLSDEMLDAIALHTFEGMPDNTPKSMIRRVIQKATAAAAVQDVQLTATVLEAAPLDREGLARAIYEAEGFRPDTATWEAEPQMVKDSYLRLADAVVAFQSAAAVQAAE